MTTMKRRYLAVLAAASVLCLPMAVRAADGGAYKVIKVQRNFAPDVPTFVEDEFVIELDAQTRGNIVVTADAIGPRVSENALQRVIDDEGVSKFDRLFQLAKPEPANSKFQDLTGYYKVKIEPGRNLDQAIAAFSRNPNVVKVEKIGIHPVYDNCATGSKLSPNDTYYDNPPPTFNFPQWDLWDAKGIDADMAWSAETGDPSVIVVAMDSGVRYFHADLGGTDPPGPADNVTNGNIWTNPFEIPNNGIDDEGNGRIDDVVGWDFVTGVTGCASGEDCSTQDNDPRDFNGHGTHTAGTMAAITNNGGGVAGVAGGFGTPGNGARIMCCRIGWSEPLGNGFVRMDFAAQAMAYVTDMKNRGVNVAAVNASWGSSNSGGIDAAVNNLLAADIMLIHAAGNSPTGSPDYLGNKAGVMNVAATDQSGAKASFSNFGAWVDIAAPGVDIISTFHVSSDPGSDYVAVLDGTSMAAPHVAGVAALLESCNPSLSGPDKFALMVSNGCVAGSSQIGSILNAKLALDAAGCGGCSVPADCNDGNECTFDDCVGGVCSNTPLADNSSCNGGAGICCGGTCSTAACSANGDCNDADLCTTDTCNNAGTCSASCSNTPVSCPPGEACNPSNGVCEPQVCDGDLICESGEDCNNCPSDCISGTSSGAVCGNGICEAGNGEDCVSCAADCNGKQNGPPSGRYCCGDGDGQNPLPCSNATCSTGGWSCTNVPVPGGSYCCGDASCGGAEDACNCALDCGSPPAENCSNGVDDDCDGLVDCADTVDCPNTQPPCSGGGCAGNKAPCNVNADCCSLNCKGGQCKGN